MSFASSAITPRLSNWRRSVLNNCARLVHAGLPENCVLCSAAAPALSLCTQCHDELPWLPVEHCPQCALPTFDGHLCGACLSRAPRFDSITAAFTYDWPLARLIQQYKYGANLALAKLFAHALAAKISGAVDLVVPMPLTPARLAERGFNQAREIARIVCDMRGVALAAHGCRRVRDSAPQATLPWKERAKNIRGAFVCDVDLRGQRVAVVDDVLTTGATLNELTRNLRKAGAVEVQGWVVARTIKP